MIAAQEGYADICRELLDNGADLRQQMKVKKKIIIGHDLGCSSCRGVSHLELPVLFHAPRPMTERALYDRGVVEKQIERANVNVKQHYI